MGFPVAHAKSAQKASRVTCPLVPLLNMTISARPSSYICVEQEYPGIAPAGHAIIVVGVKSAETNARATFEPLAKVRPVLPCATFT